MSTKIEWCEETWNPITGCSPVSEGCRNCYARRMAHRLKGHFGYPKDDFFRVTFHPDKTDNPIKWKKPRFVFVCSMGDLFHEDVKDEWINEVIRRIFNYYHHTYLILTKRPKRMKEFFNRYYDNFKLIPNLWLGVTAENQKRADERIPILLQIPAAKKFVSIEPMLENIILKEQWLGGLFSSVKIDWTICGSETGPGARYMNPDWARSIKDQCKDAGVPFFMKKMSNREPIPDDLMIREYPN